MRTLASAILATLASLLVLAGSTKTSPSPPESPRHAVHLIRIDEATPAGERRRQRLVERLDRVPRLDYVMSTVAADITSTDSVDAALVCVPDRKEDIVLAGSGLMALAARRHFHHASILFASQHDPWEIGIMQKSPVMPQPITGFTFDANPVPQVLSILARSGAHVRRVGIVVDDILGPAWLQRVEALRHALPEYRFDVFRIVDDDELARCFAAPETNDVDAWILYGTPTVFRRIDWIRAELERRGKIVVYPRRTDVEAGGLMSYETREPDPYGIWARQIVLLSEGVPASEIPVEHTSSFELAINLDAAARIGLRFPPKLVKSASLVVYERRP
jgi:putative ABC transport system substrate-binding protein